MAKKRAGRGTKLLPKPDVKEQKQFDGDGFPEKPPKAVLNARDEYITAKRDAADAAKHRGDRELNLIEKMQEHGIDRLPIDGENKFIEVSATERAKIKTIPKEQREAREGKE